MDGECKVYTGSECLEDVSSTATLQLKVSPAVQGGFSTLTFWPPDQTEPYVLPSGAYVPEGLMTSCSWDYMTFTPSVRSYTMLLFTFVFFIPLSVIIFSYCCIFRAIRHTTRLVHALLPRALLWQHVLPLRCADLTERLLDQRSVLLLDSHQHLAHPEGRCGGDSRGHMEPPARLSSFPNSAHLHDRAISKISCGGSRDSVKRLHKMKSEWKMAKIALIVILLFVVSWAPYSCAALTAFAG